MTAKPESLRPGTLDDFIGQEKLVGELKIVLEAAKQRGQMPDHMLFAGPPGLGKTTLAAIVANYLDADLVSTSAPALERPAALLGLLTSKRDSGTVLFIDEIHRMDRSMEELLYSAMEDGFIDVVIGEGPQARAHQIRLRPFTLVGATTMAGNLSGPLRDRFGFTGKLALYDTDALASIVTASAGKLAVTINDDAAKAIAGRSRGTPRVANTLLRRVRDWAQVHAISPIDLSCVEAAMGAFDIDELGLDRVARELLFALIDSFGGGPVGVKTLSAAIGETVTTIEEVYEPHLMRMGLIARTGRGRIATDRAYAHMNVERETGEAFSLFPHEL